MISLMDYFSRFLLRWRDVEKQDNIRPCIEKRGNEIFNCKTTVQIEIFPPKPPCRETIESAICISDMINRIVATPDNPNPEPASWYSRYGGATFSWSDL